MVGAHLLHCLSVKVKGTELELQVDLDISKCNSKT